MKKLLILLFLLAPLAQSSAQVDTLQLELLGQISDGDYVNGLYFTDLLGDSAKEVINIGTYYINVYDFALGQRVWNSPALTHNNPFSNYPWEVAFEDMDSDGILDMAVRDSFALRIFDVADSTVIWTSPDLRQMLSYFCLGDVNSDSIKDIVIARREPYRDDSAPDTAWIEIYNGPTFQLSERFPILVTGYRDTCTNIIEIPYTMTVARLAGAQGLETRIVIFTSAPYTCETPEGWSWGFSEGNVKIIDPISYEVITIDNVGVVLTFSAFQAEDGAVGMYATTDKHHFFSEAYGDSIFALSFSADSLLDFHLFCSSMYSFFRGPLIGEIDPGHSGDEIAYGEFRSIKAFSYPGFTPIWTRDVGFQMNGDLGLYTAPSVFEHPQIVSFYPRKIFDGIDGSLSAIFGSETERPRGIVDINTDGEDEFYERTQTAIKFYRAVRNANGIDGEMPNLPSECRLYANYPNPFNAGTSIQYDLQSSTHVNLTIYDILGNKIAVLVDREQQAGRQQVIWDASNISSGVYFYRLQAGDYTQTRRMMLLK